ncbi:MAG: type II toxin-antitoxin system RelE/ParE family toxin [Alphaproteobacteria bacterium]|jgi:mRNA interferase RelE/StbE|nr:type II toxin-antitoxin system RelE/ParE family toxin [Alphaproteobacteria bacterium]
MYKVEIKCNLEKILKAIPKKDQINIKNYIDSLDNCTDPYLHAKKIVDYKDLYRYRVGYYRILSEIKNEKLTILVIDIDHRKNIYKSL